MAPRMSQLIGTTRPRFGIGKPALSRTPASKIPGTQFGGTKVGNPDPPGWSDPGDQKRKPGTNAAIRHR